MSPKIQGEINLTVSNQYLQDLDLEIFNPLKNHGINLNQSFDNGINSTNGLSQAIIAGNVFGLQGFNVQGSLLGVNLTNTGLYFISNEKYPYNQLLDWLKGQTIRVKHIKLTSATIPQLTQPWYYRQYFPNGQNREEKIDLSNIMTPDNVQLNIATFELNRIIDKFTAIMIPMINGAILRIDMTFETV